MSSDGSQERVPVLLAHRCDQEGACGAGASFTSKLCRPGFVKLVSCAMSGQSL